MNDKEKSLTYTSAGVNTETEKEGIMGIVQWARKTLSFSACRTVLDFGFFANVLEIGMNIGLAISTDGVGTKIMISQMMNKFDTIGIDCVAMNANDILCVGARPVAMVDYVAVQGMDKVLLHEIGKGLHEGARQAGISIPGGEIAQIREMLSPEKNSFDLVGTCIGTVMLDRIIDGRDIQEGDALIGLESSGIHSNGLTLARKALFERGKFKADSYIPELRRTLGEELLEPTRIYVAAVQSLLDSQAPIKGLAHITGDGLFNLTRFNSPCGFVVETMPEAPPIFSLIQRAGHVAVEEMFKVYNMGVGFCVITSPDHVQQVTEICAGHETGCHFLGYAVKDNDRKIILPNLGMIGQEGKFYNQPLK
ncbi:MAG TPA: phosphoribosylformylglycinamidine cyclo-ligase [Thermodesulfovibrionia bacterium]|nr:phosphoribosylformylglycinamidine cyclo-ligase [Thermodesulfovibrionia bacterium]